MFEKILVVMAGVLMRLESKTNAQGKRSQNHTSKQPKTTHMNDPMEQAINISQTKIDFLLGKHTSVKTTKEEKEPKVESSTKIINPKKKTKILLNLNQTTRKKSNPSQNLLPQVKETATTTQKRTNLKKKPPTNQDDFKTAKKINLI